MMLLPRRRRRRRDGARRLAAAILLLSAVAGPLTAGGADLAATAERGGESCANENNCAVDDGGGANENDASSSPSAADVAEGPAERQMVDYYARAVRAAEEHAAWQAELLRSEPRDGTRFVVFWPRRTGMGNVLEAMVSTYLFAMITRRVFVVRWTPWGQGLAGGISRELSDVLDWPLDPIPEDDARVQRHLEAAEAGGGRKGLTRRLTDHKGRLVLSPELVGEDLRDPDQRLNREERVLVLNGNMYFADLFFYNPHLKEWLAERFGPRSLDGGGHGQGIPFKPLFRWLVRPNPSVRAVIEDVKRREFGDVRTVGIQARMSESYGRLEQADTFWDCAERAMADDGETPDSPAEAAPVATADGSDGGGGDSGGATSTTRYFLATDNPAVQTAARERFGDGVFWASDLRTVVSGLSERRDPDQITAAVVDLFLLADCDALVVTQGSSFGRMAHGAAGLRPWFVTVQHELWNTRGREYNVCLRSVTPKLCSYRNHKVLLEPKPLPFLSEGDVDEAYAECDMS